ncbi:DUF427 domain-containing protein [Kiloniella sp.]|uniref:DUF427 domain-containing protein n=1 Tax=Kiloniella sp. TaxID=1938587 RepID=UPI003B02E4F9
MIENETLSKPALKIIAWDGHITMEAAECEVVVYIDRRELARSQNAILFYEGDRAPIYYIPHKDIDETYLKPSDFRTHCKWKGEAHYLSYKGDDVNIENVLWLYPEAHDPVAAIRDHVSFDLKHAEVSKV